MSSVTVRNSRRHREHPVERVAGGRRRHRVEVAEVRLQVGDAAIGGDRERRPVAGGAADRRERRAAHRHRRAVGRRHLRPRLEVVEQVELLEVDDALRDLVDDAVERRRPSVGEPTGAISILSMLPLSNMPEGVTTSPPPAARTRSLSKLSRPISALNAPTRNSRMEIVRPWAKNGRTRRSGSTPTTAEVLTVPSALAVIEPKLTPFAVERQRRRHLVRSGLVERLRADRAQGAGHLVGELLLQAEAEQVGRVAAVRTRDDVAAVARRSAGPPVAGGARVGETGRDAGIAADEGRISDAVIGERPVALRHAGTCAGRSAGRGGSPWPDRG